MSIEEIRTLVELEKEAEEELGKAKEKADNLIEKAKIDARRILQEAEDPKHYLDIFNAKSEEMDDAKRQTEKEINEKVERTIETAQKNLEKTISFIVEQVFGE
jgi:vacuolar-type H+-ATPase subunit H